MIILEPDQEQTVVASQQLTTIEAEAVVGLALIERLLLVIRLLNKTAHLEEIHTAIHMVLDMVTRVQLVTLLVEQQVLKPMLKVLRQHLMRTLKLSSVVGSKAPEIQDLTGTNQTKMHMPKMKAIKLPLQMLH